MNYLRQSRFYFDGPGAAGVLFLRVFVGVVFICHGWGKIQTPFAWLDARGPSHIPGALQALAACSEFFGGMALLLGLLTPLACLGLMCTMATAVFLSFKSHKPFFFPNPGAMEPSACYFVIALMILLLGPGLLSLDSDFFGKGGGSSPAKKGKR